MMYSLPDIRKDVNLSEFNTLGIRAIAPAFMEVKHPRQLIEMSKGGLFQSADYFILGGGSNVLFKDRLDLAVIKISIPGIKEEMLENGDVFIHAGAGVNWHDLVTYCSEKGYGGIENLALIPGTAGAAPVQNIGAYGVELADVLEEIEVYNVKLQRFQRLNKEACEFGYRDSIFKRTHKKNVIVTSITLRLKTANHTPDISYAVLRDYLGRGSGNAQTLNPSILDVYHAVIRIRNSKLPDPGKLANAGSFFKNPVIDKAKLEEVRKKYPDIPFFPAGEEKVKVPAAWLIEKSGWKGKRVGNTGTYKHQALVIVNYGNATGREILEFSEQITRSVKKNFEISLEREVNLIE